MDKIFKNDKIMGIVAVATLALVAVMYFKNCKKEKDSTATVPAAPATAE
ncbi:MAG: hypothetical protein IJZ06_07985 [Bacteroidales bacterium]|nr:hypothetical protein [Bacteroidales bacterium]